MAALGEVVGWPYPGALLERHGLEQVAVELLGPEERSWESVPTKPVGIRKNAAETLRVERTDYRGKDLLAVRVFTGRPGDPQARPTRKGLTLHPATWKELLPVLERLLEKPGDNGEDTGDN